MRSFWAFLDGWSRYLATGIDHATVYEWKHFRLPDVNMYLTSYGPSYRVQTGIRASSTLYFPLAYEWVFLGEQQRELTLGVTKTWASGLHSSTEFRGGQKIGFTQKFSKPVTSKMHVGLGVDYVQFENLYGERHILSLKDDNHTVEVFGNIKLVF